MGIIPQPPKQKFLFNRSFDGVVEEIDAPKEPPPPTYSQEELDAACQTAQKQGYSAGEAAEKQSQQAQLITLTTQLMQHMEQLVQEAMRQSQRQQDDLATIALIMARKMLPESIAEHALVGITTMVAQVCKDMAREPRLVVRVADALLDPLQQALTDITQRQAYAGKIVLLADDTLQIADCKIEWADGGIEYDTNAVWQQIETAVRQAKSLAENQETPPSPTAQE